MGNRRADYELGWENLYHAARDKSTLCLQWFEAVVLTFHHGRGTQTGLAPANLGKLRRDR